MRRIKSYSLLIAAYLIFLLKFPTPATADRRKESIVAPGVRHFKVYRREGPWAINILEIDRGRKDVKIATVLAGDRILGGETVSSCVKRLRGKKKRIIAAINGDFFAIPKGTSYADPAGLQILNGELISTPSRRSCFFVRRDGRVSIDVVQLDGWFKTTKGKRRTITGLNQYRSENDVVLFNYRFGESTKTNKWGTEAVIALDEGGRRKPKGIVPNRPFRGIVKKVVKKSGDSTIPPSSVVLSGHGKSSVFIEKLKPGSKVTLDLDLKVGNKTVEILEAIGGTPRLIRDGEISVEWKAERCAKTFAKNRSPRTAIGFNKKRIILVTVDGRLPGYSAGMTLDELAALMRELGCEQAMNLDGGGSTVMFVKNKIVNRPAELRERPVANFVVVYLK